MYYVQPFISHGVRKIYKFHLLGAEHNEEEDGWSHAGFLPSCPSCRGVVGDVEKHALRDLKVNTYFVTETPHLAPKCYV